MIKTLISLLQTILLVYQVKYKLLKEIYKASALDTPNQSFTRTKRFSKSEYNTSNIWGKQKNIMNWFLAQNVSHKGEGRER